MVFKVRELKLAIVKVRFVHFFFNTVYTSMESTLYMYKLRLLLLQWTSCLIRRVVSLEGAI
jgi:hypothetical protein